MIVRISTSSGFQISHDRHRTIDVNFYDVQRAECVILDENGKAIGSWTGELAEQDNEINRLENTITELRNEIYELSGAAETDAAVDRWQDGKGEG